MAKFCISIETAHTKYEAEIVTPEDVTAIERGMDDLVSQVKRVLRAEVEENKR